MFDPDHARAASSALVWIGLPDSELQVLVERRKLFGEIVVHLVDRRSHCILSRWRLGGDFPDLSVGRAGLGNLNKTLSGVSA
jgi:hypothetical protein